MCFLLFWALLDHMCHTYGIKPLNQQPVNWTWTMKTAAVCTSTLSLLRLLCPRCHMYRSRAAPDNKSPAMRQDAASFIPPTLPPCSMKPCGGWPLTSGKQPDKAGRHSPLGGLAEHLLGGWLKEWFPHSCIHCHTKYHIGLNILHKYVFGYMCSAYHANSAVFKMYYKFKK